MTRTRLAIAGGLATVVAVAALGGWYFLIRDDAPPPVNLAAAVAAAAAEQAATASAADAAAPTASATRAAATTTPAPTPTATATEEPQRRPDGELSGVWRLSEQGESFAGYRVQEQLANIGSNTAVGRSSALTASLEFDGAAITSVEIEVDLTRLRSDDSRRDRQLRSRGLETNTFPTASFVLTEPIALDGVPAEGTTIAVTAVGDFTLHGVTRNVEMPIEGQLLNGLLVIIGSLEIEFADYQIDLPTGFVVLSIEDRGVMEFQLVFE